MKKALKLGFILFITFVIVSCKKEMSISTLDGTWELRSVTGGQMAGASPNFEPGNGNQIKFNQQRYERYADGKLVETGKYTLSPEKREVNNDEANFSMLSNNNFQQYIKLSSKKLVIFTGVIAADGIEEHYLKLK
ncbi:MAG: hypothetical protein JWQ28_2101 [Pedobacter sp.]|jgi:hypothetical protein|nr:hypothetical protein [Pedobacter sp.]